MTYEDYVRLNGKVSEADFTSLIDPVCDFLQSYIETYVLSSLICNQLEDYGNFEKAIVYQIDYLNENGGIRVFYGSSDTDIESVTTSGYTYKVGDNVIKHNGVPLSPLSKALIMKELRRNGYLKRVMS